MNDKYILTEDHRVLPAPDLLTWARWFEANDRSVGLDKVGPYRVSTVFLGMDHDFARFMNDSPVREPLIFETMIFDSSRDETSPFFSRKFHPAFNFQRRYRTWDAAVAGHAYAKKISERMLRWMEFREIRRTAEVNELNKMLL